jgi:hypothetical protein
MDRLGTCEALEAATRTCPPARGIEIGPGHRGATSALAGANREDVAWIPEANT